MLRPPGLLRHVHAVLGCFFCMPSRGPCTPGTTALCQCTCMHLAASCSATSAVRVGLSPMLIAMHGDDLVLHMLLWLITVAAAGGGGVAGYLRGCASVHVLHLRCGQVPGVIQAQWHCLWSDHHRHTRAAGGYGVCACVGGLWVYGCWCACAWFQVYGCACACVC